MATITEYRAGPGGEYEDITGGHPWEPHPRGLPQPRESRTLRCPNCFLVLELMRDRRNTMVAARITPAGPERPEGACGGRAAMQEEEHFLREPGSRRMVRVEARLFHRKARSAGIRVGAKPRGFRVGHNPREVRECRE